MNDNDVLTVLQSENRELRRYRTRAEQELQLYRRDERDRIIGEIANETGFCALPGASVRDAIALAETYVGYDETVGWTFDDDGFAVPLKQGVTRLLRRIVAGHAGKAGERGNTAAKRRVSQADKQLRHARAEATRLHEAAKKRPQDVFAVLAWRKAEKLVNDLERQRGPER